MPELSEKPLMDKGLCDYGLVHHTMFNVDAIDHASRIANGTLTLAVCELWLDSHKLTTEGVVTCVECLASHLGCR